MNKSQKMLLDDYINGKLPIRLDIFLQSYNVKITAGQKKQLGLLIEDYDKDRTNKQRLNNIESFVLGGNQPTKQSKIKSKPILVPNKPNSLSNLVGPKVELNEKMKLRLELAEKVRALRATFRDLTVSEQLEYNNALDQIKVIEREEGMLGSNYGFNQNPEMEKESKISQIIGCLGDWEQEGTVSWQILNGHMKRFSFRSPMDPKVLIDWMKDYAGLEPKKFIVQSMVGSDMPNKSIEGKGSTYTLTLVSSNLPPVGNMSVQSAETGAPVMSLTGGQIDSLAGMTK